MAFLKQFGGVSLPWWNSSCPVDPVVIKCRCSTPHRPRKGLLTPPETSRELSTQSGIDRKMFQQHPVQAEANDSLRGPEVQGNWEVLEQLPKKYTNDREAGTGDHGHDA